MRVLDQSRPYGEVTGPPGACWEQDGVLFNLQGFPVEMGPDGRVRRVELPEAPAPEPEPKKYKASKFKNKLIEHTALERIYGTDSASIDEDLDSLFEHNDNPQLAPYRGLPGDAGRGHGTAHFDE